MKLQRRVVVTGLGLITPLGNDVSSSWDSCINGKSGITTFDNSIKNSPVTIGGRIHDLDIESYIEPKDVRRLDPLILTVICLELVLILVQVLAAFKLLKITIKYI